MDQLIPYARIRLNSLLYHRFCEHRKLDPMEVLCQCDVPLFKVYLVWRVKNSRIKKESTVMTYWKVLSMVYSQKTASWMREEVLYDVRHVSILIFSVKKETNISQWIH